MNFEELREETEVEIISMIKTKELVLDFKIQWLLQEQSDCMDHASGSFG